MGDSAEKGPRGWRAMGTRPQRRTAAVSLLGVARRPCRLTVLAALAAFAILAALTRPAAADPVDRLAQHVQIGLTTSGANVQIAMIGGLIANERILDQLDTNHDGQVSPAEERAYADRLLQDLSVTLDDRPVPLAAGDLHLTVPPVKDFHLGLAPLVVAFRVPFPQSHAPTSHILTIRDDYLTDMSDYPVAVQTAAGATVTSAPLPSRIARVAFRLDPAAAGAGDDTAVATTAWGGSGVIGRAKAALERPKTPALLLSLIGIFLVMGALHALQPGHGKTLVAAYLVATGGTARDAMALAGIVTFTHTISVFALGLATLAASEFFLPSRVVPVLGVVSGLLVVGMGANMLRGAVHRARRATSPTHHHHHHDHAHPHDPPHSHDQDHDHDHLHHPSPMTHHPDHDHAGLSDAEHARLHLAEIERARGHGRGVSVRSLVTLGVSGGIAPCPDALAILLLAVGINQFALGMLAIVAFSFGLAGVLVAFGLAVALAGPFWQRLRHRRSPSSRLGGGLTRLATLSPLLSAVVVLLLGLAMLWRSASVGL